MKPALHMVTKPSSSEVAMLRLRMVWVSSRSGSTGTRCVLPSSCFMPRGRADSGTEGAAGREEGGEGRGGEGRGERGGRA